MLSPGAKGWIAKYFQMMDTGEIAVTWDQPKQLSDEQFNHFFLVQSGLVFGYTSRLMFAHNVEQKHWTKDEQLTTLLFEAHLFTYIRSLNGAEFDRKEFIEILYTFYKHHRVNSLSSLIGYFLKETKEEKIERILDKRTEVPKQLLSTKSWMTYLTNTFVYLDVLLFDAHLKPIEGDEVVDYQQLAMLSLAIISLSAYSDNVVEDQEKLMFESFLASADLDGDEREIAKLRFKRGVSLNELGSELIDNWNFRRYLLDLSALTIFSNHDAGQVEIDFLESLRKWLDLSQVDLDDAIVAAQQFVLQHRQQVAFLHDASAVESMIDNVSKRWIKILGRNKDKLAVELRQSKELLFLIKKSTTEELTKEEKEKVKVQFLDIVKSMPALAIFLLPGGAVLLPIVLRIIPTLVPSAFKENDVT